MQHAAVTGVPAPRVPPDYAAARRWLWRALVVVIVGAWAGTTWDRIWHATVPFDGFWSPPHIVVYVTVASVSFMVMGLVFSARLRRAFGRGFDVIILPFKVPGPLFILGGGLVLLSLAGAVFDNLWHTAFGLNETGWSFPHAMIGTSLMLVAFGFVSCRLAMQPEKPMPWFTTLLLASLTATMIFNVVLGPIGGNRTPESVSFFFSYIPALASQDSSQAVYRIYDTWNLNRTHPALLLLAPLALGIILGWVRRLDARWWMTLLIMALVYLLDSGNRDFGDLIAQYVPEFAREANWRALPVMIPTLAVLILPRLRMGERLSYALAGILFALLIFNIWGAEGPAWLLAFAAAPLMLVGKRIGERLYAILAQPWSFEAVLPVVASAVVIPLVTGCLDLALRLSTP